MTALPEDDDDRDVVRKGPDAFRTISEVAEDLGLPQHVLRFWETRFPQIKPIKRGGGRRYYRPNDVDLLRGIKQLLYGEGYTIRGVQRILREQGGRKIAQAAGVAPGADAAAPAGPATPAEPRLSGAPSGPDMWAPGRRQISTPEPESADPDAGDDAYQAADGVGDFQTEPQRDARPQPAAPQGSAPAQGGGARLTDDQVGRLSAALDELAACRRLLENRS